MKLINNLSNYIIRFLVVFLPHFSLLIFFYFQTKNKSGGDIALRLIWLFSFLFYFLIYIFLIFFKLNNKKYTFLCLIILLFIEISFILI